MQPIAAFGPRQRLRLPVYAGYLSRIEKLAMCSRPLISAEWSQLLPPMAAQYTIAGATGGLVIGTDHAAEAVMGFFTKFGDGSCDLAPLSGLVKNQVRAIAQIGRASCRERV